MVPAGSAILPDESARVAAGSAMPTAEIAAMLAASSSRNVLNPLTHLRLSTSILLPFLGRRTGDGANLSHSPDRFPPIQGA